MDLIEDFFALESYRSPPDPVKCLVEYGVSKSGSGDQDIPQY